MSDSPERKNDRSLKHFHTEAATSSVETAASAYQMPSLVAGGAADRDVGLLSSVTNIILSLVLIKLPSLLDSFGSLKRFTLVCAFLSIVTWVPLMVAFFVFNQISSSWLIALWVLSLIPTLASTPLRDNWLSEKIPSKNMGRYLSMRSAISAVAYLTSFYLMGYLLDLSGTHIFKGYSLIILLAFGSSIGTFLLYKRISPPESDRWNRGRVYFGFNHFLKEVVRGGVGRFVLYVSLMYFSVHLCSAFFTVYILRDLGLNYLIYMLIISAEYVARIISLNFLGKLVDRHGSMRVLGFISRFIPLIPVLWLFSRSPAYLVAIQLFSGVVWAAFDLCNQTFIYQNTPSDLRLRYIIYHKSLSTFAIAAGALAGALWLNHVFPIFGNRILGLFLVSGILRLVVLLTVFPVLNRQVREEVNNTDNRLITKRSVRDVPVNRVIPPYTGLLYRPEMWSVFREKVYQPVMHYVRPGEKRGLFYSPEKWSEIVKIAIPDRQRTLKVRPTTPPVPVMADAGLVTKQDEMPKLRRVYPEGLERYGLFYRSADWSAYIKNIRAKKLPRAVYTSGISYPGPDRTFKRIRPLAVN